MANLLIIDDDPKICQFLSQLFKEIGHDIYIANTLKKGLDISKKQTIDLVLLDLEFPEGSGLQILPDLLEEHSRPEVIIITGTGDANGAELAFKYGAWDYVQKPFLMEEVSLPVTRALQYRAEKETLKIPLPLARTEIIGNSSTIETCLAIVAKAAITDASVLITGKTGTGKELFARAVHQNSKRSTESFITVDCGALPETLVEGILFGHEKGAFTGAEKKREGLVRQADGGTLFLDEIGDLPLNTQKSLLRTLQEKVVRPLGANREFSVDFRLIAATNRNLDEMVKDGRFREDLLFRISAIEIKLPPLKDRDKDIQEIAINKILELGRRHNLGIKGVSPEFLEALTAQEWSGNVRELINVLEFSLASAGRDPTLFPKHLPPKYRTSQLEFDSTVESIENGESYSFDNTDSTNSVETPFPTWPEFRNQSEKNYLKSLLNRSKGSRQEACRLSGISQSRLYGLLQKHNLSKFGSS